METTRATTIVERLKNVKINDGKSIVTNFVEDTHKLTRYSLADKGIAETPNTTKMEYNITLITPEDKACVLDFLKKTFFRDEPLNQSVQLISKEDSRCIELESYSISSLSDNCSFMATDNNNSIIGIILNGKMEPPKLSEPDYITNCEHKKFQKILRLLYFVDKNANIPSKYPGEDALEIRIISVDSNWRGKGIAGALIRKSIDFAKESGFDLVRCDCSSLFSGKLCQKIGFDKVYELKYEDYVDEEGRPIFSPAEPHTAVVTYIKRL